MILSISRRTDIPALYTTWLFNRLAEGFVLVRNPFNFNQVSKVYLDPNVVDCIVFWTKNPKRMIPRLDELSKFNYYFQFTLNSYDKSLEPNIPSKKYLLNTFYELSNSIGKDKVIWRYDPIILTNHYTIEYHLKWFEYLASKLSNYTNKCVISFLDLYSKTKRNLKDIKLLPLTTADMRRISLGFSEIALKYNIKLETCSEDINLSEYNISHGKCIDDRLISTIIGQNISIDKDSNQRTECGCIKSIDIGQYNSCKHGCLYCYANYSYDVVTKSIAKHNNKSPFLIGDLNGDESITERKMESYIKKQITFL